MHPADQLFLNFAVEIGVAALTVVIGGAILSRLTRPRKAVERQMTAPDFYGTDPASRAWRREQMAISNDFAGIPRDSHLDAMTAALDALVLTDEQRITATTAYFRSLAAQQPQKGP